MKLSKDKIEKFKIIYKKDYGIDLDDYEAEELAKEFLGLIKITYGKYPRENLTNFENYYKIIKSSIHCLFILCYTRIDD